ncbi:MAG: hypothetical protein ACOYL6_15985 [Bacteriovoracaceae bacterium]
MKSSIITLMTLFLFISCGPGKTLSSNSVAKKSVEIIQPTNLTEFHQEKYLNVARSALQAHQNKVGFLSPQTWMKPFVAYAAEIECGSVITENITVSGTLDCSKYEGEFALILYGKQAKLDGGKDGFKILFPQGKIGLILSGEAPSVEHVEVSGLKEGVAVMVFDAEDATIINSEFNSNMIGVFAYADSTKMSGLQIEDNTISGSSLFGIHVNSNFEKGIFVSTPVIHNNNLSNSESYALHLRTDQMNFNDEENKNTFSGSQNGFYLTGGIFSYDKMSLDNQENGIEKTIIFVSEASEFSMKSSQLVGTGKNIDQDAYGLHLYKVEKISIEDIQISSFDVGIKISSDQNQSSEISIKDGEISTNSLAGIMIQAYDEKASLDFDITDIKYDENSVHDLWLVGIEKQKS